jgi:acyl-CoA synthetase (AMP-forming)/AMP-acid ligase II
MLLRHELIDEACVFGAPDEEAGETIVAVVCGVPDATPDSELEAWCRTKLPAYQVPTAWLRLTSLPRNSMGKVNKTQLKESLLSS